jgi:hypothetical protein
LCVGAGNKERCYEPPKQDPPFALNPNAHEVKVETGARLILFTAESSSGGSGSLTILSLLEDRNNHLIDLLPKVTVTNQSEYCFWDLPNLSAMPVFVTADFVWAEGETHFARHRYRITSYAYHKQTGRYVQRDQYVTAKKYPGLDESDTISVLAPEKATIVARLKGKHE